MVNFHYKYFLLLKIHKEKHALDFNNSKLSEKCSLVIILFLSFKFLDKSF